MNTSQDHYRRLLQDSDLKFTQSRLALLGLLSKIDGPIDADDIHLTLKEQKVSLDRATVYRILEAFYKKGIVTRFEFQEGKFRYELAGSDHHHLICEACGKIEDISDCGIEDWEKQIKRKKGFIVKRHALEFFGICQNCQP